MNGRAVDEWSHPSRSEDEWARIRTLLPVMGKLPDEELERFSELELEDRAPSPDDIDRMIVAGLILSSRRLREMRRESRGRKLPRFSRI
jgi:hypothetical protein